MAKKNSRQSTAAQTTVEHVAEAPQPESTEAPANDQAPSHDLAGLDDKALHALLVACLAEVKTRKEEALSLLPPIGSTVKILAGKWQGKSGELVSRGKTRCHIRIEGFPLPAYVLITDAVPA